MDNASSPPPNPVDSPADKEGLLKSLEEAQKKNELLELELALAKEQKKGLELREQIAALKEGEAQCTALLLSGVPHSDQMLPSASASPAVQDTLRSTPSTSSRPSTSSEGRQSFGQPAAAGTPRRGRPRRTNATSPDARETPKKRGRPRLSAANVEPPKKRGRPSKK